MRLFIGHDTGEQLDFDVAVRSIQDTSPNAPTIEPIELADMQRRGLYTRPTRVVEPDIPGGPTALFDEISDAPMSTGFAISRFLIPLLCDFQGWAFFADQDVLFRRDLAELFTLADDRYAIMCVPHIHDHGVDRKKGGHAQSYYARKNWSSVMLINCGHPANRCLSRPVVNTWPGRTLHGFGWLADDNLIGSLPFRWNYLIGVSEPTDDVAIAHFTLGSPRTGEFRQTDRWLVDEFHAVADQVEEIAY